MKDLAVSITDTISMISDQVVNLTIKNSTQDAVAILNEWTTESGECVLTKYLQGTTDTIEDRFLYATIDEFNVEAGMFHFITEPIDTN